MLVGLLHDLDYDCVKDDMSRHGVLASEMLKGKISEKSIYAIKAHDHRTGFKPSTRLDWALIATDSLASLIEKNGKNVAGLRVETLRADLQRLFEAQPWHRDNVFKCEEIGVAFDEFLELCLGSMKRNLTTS
jgi:predicted hydrolase (HD superfamily)